MKRNETLFILSTLFFLLAGLLYAWGPPDWLDAFPYSAGLRFLLALEAYFLCCAAFFAFRLAGFPRAEGSTSVPAFCLAFAPIPVFATLVVTGRSVQTLQTFCQVLDIVCWLSLLTLAFRTREKKDMLIIALFTLTGALLAIPAIPSIVPELARLVAFAIFIAVAVQNRAGAIVTGSWEQLEVGEASVRFALSPRETEVLALIVAGKTNDEIAKALFVSLSTVKTHIASIFAKTGARNRLEASALCRKN
jgi:DNA-binding CsgD family transcriptional regulator